MNWRPFEPSKEAVAAAKTSSEDVVCTCPHQDVREPDHDRSCPVWTSSAVCDDCGWPDGDGHAADCFYHGPY